MNEWTNKRTYVHTVEHVASSKGSLYFFDQVESTETETETETETDTETETETETVAEMATHRARDRDGNGDGHWQRQRDITRMTAVWKGPGSTRACACWNVIETDRFLRVTRA